MCVCVCGGGCLVLLLFVVVVREPRWKSVNGRRPRKP